MLLSPKTLLQPFPSVMGPYISSSLISEVSFHFTFWLQQQWWNIYYLTLTIKVCQPTIKPNISNSYFLPLSTYFTISILFTQS